MPVRVIVTDDGSRDETPAILARIAAEDARLSVSRTEGLGVSTARNLALERITQEDTFIGFLDGDDVMLPDWLADATDALEAAPHADMVYSHDVMVHEDAMAACMGIRTHEGARTGVSMSAGLYRRTFLDKAGPLDPSIAVGEDLDWLLRGMEHGAQVIHIERIARLYRRHSGNVTADQTRLRREVARVMLQHVKRRRADPSLGDAAALFGRGGATPWVTIMPS